MSHISYGAPASLRRFLGYRPRLAPRNSARQRGSEGNHEHALFGVGHIMDAVAQELDWDQLLNSLDAQELHNQVLDSPEILPELDAPPEPQGLTLADALAPGSAASFIALLRGGREIPDAQRPALIRVLEEYQAITASNRPAAIQTGNVRLIQDGVIIPNPALGDDGKSSFPHIVELNGAQSAHDEACEWQQYKTKQTHITVQLQDKQGAPPPRPLVAPM